MSNNQNFIEEINNEILTLFRKQENKPECIPYLFPKDVKANPDLLFIGINPSIKKKGFAILKNIMKALNK